MNIDSKQLENLEMYKRIVDHMGESIWIGDTEEKTIYANPNFCNIMEYTLEEMIGRESYDFRDPESAKVVASNNEIRKEGESSKYEGVLKSKTGKLIPVLCSGTPIPGGGTVGIMTDLREVNDLKRTKDELKKLNKTKDEFISIVGHELRTPLTIANGYISMLLDGDMGELNKATIDSIEKIYNSNKDLLQIINDMLELSKLEMGNLTYYDIENNVKDLIQSIYDDLSLVYKNKPIKFNLEFDGKFNDSIIKVDSNRFRQVIVNLVNNAFKFTQTGGTITLKVIDKLKKVEFQIMDTGIGISEEQLTKIFNKFHQIESSLSRTNEGLGLGLSIISGIMKNYKSKIKVTSKEWVGSKFFFELKKVKSI